MQKNCKPASPLTVKSIRRIPCALSPHVASESGNGLSPFSRSGRSTSIGKPAPIAKATVTSTPCRLVCWRMTCTRTAARIGPAQGVQTRPISAPIARPLTKSALAALPTLAAEIGRTLCQAAEFLRQAFRQHTRPSNGQHPRETIAVISGSICNAPMICRDSKTNTLKASDKSEDDAERPRLAPIDRRRQDQRQNRQDAGRGDQRHPFDKSEAFDGFMICSVFLGINFNATPLLQ